MAHRSITPASMARRLLETAREQGFDLAATLPVPPSPPDGAALPAGPWTSPDTAARYRGWLEQGFHGEMAYLSRPDAMSGRLHPETLLPGLTSILVVGINYHAAPLPEALGHDPSRGIIAGYARGADYHAVIKEKLACLIRAAEAVAYQDILHKACVDTSPVLERDLAAQAGLGFLGKNTCLINPGMGSWLFLGELFLPMELPPAGLPESRYANPAQASMPSCGRCLRCIQACPTGALVAPHLLDSRRCLSYLTVELKGPIPRDLRPLVGNRIFGCDICQEVCPWNRSFSRPTAEPAFAPRPDCSGPRLLDLMLLDEAGFSERFRGGPLHRARRRGLLRNAAVSLGNWGSPEAVPALVRALQDTEPLVRGHVAWALGQIGTARARRALASALSQETDPWAAAEVSAALHGR